MLSEVELGQGRLVASILGLDVGSLEASFTRVGNGQVAECRRWVLSDATHNSQSVVVKFPSSDPTSRATAQMQHLYERETAFYSILRPQVSIPTPDLLDVRYDAVNDDFLIILEDLTPSRPLDQFAGLNVDDAVVALRALAGLHAPTAHRPDLFVLPWLGGVATELRPMYEAVLPLLFNQFLERYDEIMDDDVRCTVAKVRDSIVRYDANPPQLSCVLHGDYRTDNLIFDGADGAKKFAVVDWQTVGVGGPLTDVAYFVTTSLGLDERRNHEHELIDIYRHEMSQLGVDVSLELARKEFARSTIQPIIMLVSASMIVERTERGDKMFLTMIKRAVDATSDWDAFGELG